MMVIGIVQARMGSTRLPGKVLQTILEKTVLEHIVDRLRCSKLVNKIIVATAEERTDDEIEYLCNRKNITCFRGSQDDVLDRFYRAALMFSADIVVRITADDPLKDPEIVDKAIQIMLENDYDYVSNTIEPTYPEGIDVEVFTFAALKKAHQEARRASEREHVTPYIWKNPDEFKIYNFKNGQDFSSFRWTLDTEDDLIFIRKVYTALYKEGQTFLMKDVLELIEKEPSLSLINNGHERNEGYIKSILQEELR